MDSALQRPGDLRCRWGGGGRPVGAQLLDTTRYELGAGECRWPAQQRNTAAKPRLGSMSRTQERRRVDVAVVCSGSGEMRYEHSSKPLAAGNTSTVSACAGPGASWPSAREPVRLRHKLALHAWSQRDHWRWGDDRRWQARPSPLFVLGLPHVTLTGLRLALTSYQDYHMLLLTPAPSPPARVPRRIVPPHLPPRPHVPYY